MGIRIHKALGYGIADLKTAKDGEFDDPRIDGEEFSACQDALYEMDWKKFQEWLKSEKEALIQFHLGLTPYPRPGDDCQFEFAMMTNDKTWPKKPENPDPGSHVIWDPEFGLPNVMLFVPTSCHSWMRYDDPIDYHEFTYSPKGQINRIKTIEGCCGIFPWSSSMACMTKAPAAIAPGLQAFERNAVRGWMSGGDYNQLVGRWDKKTPALAKGETLQFLLENYRPYIPLEATCLLWFLREAFKDVKAFTNSLRPMIYTYWA